MPAILLHPQHITQKKNFPLTLLLNCGVSQSCASFETLFAASHNHVGCTYSLYSVNTKPTYASRMHRAKETVIMKVSRHSAEFKCLRIAKLRWYYNACFILNISPEKELCSDSFGRCKVSKIAHRNAHTPLVVLNMLCR